MRERSLPFPFAPSDRAAIVSRGRQAIVKSPRPISRDARVPRYTALRAALGMNGWGDARRHRANRDMGNSWDEPFTRVTARHPARTDERQNHFQFRPPRVIAQWSEIGRAHV